MDGYHKQWLYVNVVPDKVIMNAGYTLTFLNAYTLLDDVERSCLHKGQDYTTRGDVEWCNKQRNKIAHADHTLDRKTCEKALGILEGQFRDWALL